MRKSKIKRIFKSKAMLFICSFIAGWIIFILSDKFLGFRGDYFTWEELLFSPFLIIGSLLFASWMTWVAFDEWGNV